MKLELNRKEVENIIFEWAEKEMPGKFNTVIFKTYGGEVELIYDADICKESKEEKKDECVPERTQTIGNCNI